MKLLKFSSRFPDEQSCVDHLREVRERIGIVCDNEVNGGNIRFTHRLIVFYVNSPSYFVRIFLRLMKHI